jgi:hypothetical protein
VPDLPVRRPKLDRYELTGFIGPAHFYLTLDAAVAAYRRDTGADWIVAAGDEVD